MASVRAPSTVKGNRFVAILRLASFFLRKWDLPRLTRPRTDRRCAPFSPRYPSCFPYPSLILHEFGARSLAPPRALFSPPLRRTTLRAAAELLSRAIPRARPMVFLLLLYVNAASARGTEERGGEVERGRRSTPGFRETRAAGRRRILGAVRKRRSGSFERSG